MERIEKPWSKEKLEAWVKERAEGIQYHTGFGPVYCPKRDWLVHNNKREKPHGLSQKTSKGELPSSSRSDAREEEAG